MRKNGFTLVELLAVIAILSLLVIIALPNIIDLFNEAKKNSFETELKNIYKTAQNQWMNDSMFDTQDIVYSNIDGFTGKKLSLSGRQEVKYYIKIGKSGNVVEYCSTDNTNQYFYEGSSLLVTELNSSENVAETIDDMLVEITPSGCERKGVGKEITVCTLTHHMYNLNIGRETRTCNSKQTVNECLGYTYSGYIYKMDEFNPEKSILQYCYEQVSVELGGLTLDNYRTFNTRCTSDTSYYNSVSKTDIVLPTTSGCYSQQLISLSCLDGDTEVEVYDKKKKKKLKKKLKDITYDDLILCWDFDKGEFTYEKPLWIMKPCENNSITILTFSDKTTLTIVGDHRIYDVDNGLFVSGKDASIGLHTFNNNGEIVKLVNKEYKEEKTYAYNVIVRNHINMFAGGILTSQGSNNIYDIKDMKFVKEDREQFNDEELNNINRDYIEGLRLKEWKVLDKGSREETLKDMYEYINRLMSNKK